MNSFVPVLWSEPPVTFSRSDALHPTLGRDPALTGEVHLLDVDRTHPPERAVREKHTRRSRAGHDRFHADPPRVTRSGDVSVRTDASAASR